MRDFESTGWSNSRSKRFMDLSFSSTFLVIFGPLMVLALGWATVAFRASPLFRQIRIGVDGKPFVVWKVRTMPTTVPANLNRAELTVFHEERGVAKALRRWHVDELPQLLNVVLGTMSLVGPRPMIPSIVAELDPSLAKIRHGVRPGLTGLWQISTRGRSKLHADDPLDLVYVMRASPLVDCRILLTTAMMLVGLPQLNEHQILERYGAVNADSLYRPPPTAGHSMKHEMAQ